jgi:DNA-directed RNA polymerase subunit beta
LRPSDILVGKIAKETELNSEERLLRAIFVEKAGKLRTSLKFPMVKAGL